MSPARSADLVAPLRAALGPVVERAGLLLEDVTVAAGGRRTVVRVVVDLPDGPGGVGSDTLTQVTRDVSAELDEADIVPGAYTLEVTTPGVDRPLRTPRHFRRATGRLVRLVVAGQEVTGRVVGADDAGLELDVEGRRRTVTHGQVEDARVQVELKRPAAGDGER